MSEKALRGALSSERGNVTRAAKLVGVSAMQLHRLINKYGLRTLAREIRVEKMGSATGRPRN